MHRRSEGLGGEIRGGAAVEHRQQGVDVAQRRRLVERDAHLRNRKRTKTLLCMLIGFDPRRV